MAMMKIKISTTSNIEGLHIEGPIEGLCKTCKAHKTPKEIKVIET
jgi:hypothetical protein